ncbi:amidohydrolase [Parahaliea maris]|uniref:Amidohydrolase n=1 Tax=Parahaliea maris TaxID=2716870 RepID=A0A5C9A2T1_9GAMM|nr:amidohydrolase [Parahaliea maris]TXS94080.1 amidohydrolase [Parahaliea maris]
MKKNLLVALALCLGGVAQAATLVHNVNGYTLNGSELEQFVALEFDDGKVTRLYREAEAALASRAGERIDGKGATLLPGLIDAHGHVSSWGRALATVDLIGSASEGDAAGRVAAYLAEHPDTDWVQGRGWNQVLWPGKDFPGRAALDAVAPDQAVVLARVDGHAIWVNSRALALAGISAATPDPDGGQILRDADGEPTGVLIDNAMNLVYGVMPADGVAEFAALQHTALEDLARYGLTAVHDAGISAREAAAYQQLRAEGRLPIRVYAMLDVTDPGNDRYLEQGPLVDPAHQLDIRSVKIVSDGALGSRGAALFADYSDDPGNRGLLLQTREELANNMHRAVAAGYQVNTHAIGDRANALVLDLYETLNSDPDSAALRHRVEHAQILRPEDIARFPALNVIASVQPTHATSDMNMAGDRLGAERLRGAYAWESLLESGAHMAGGSDFPVEAANPFFGLYSAITRQDHAGQPPGGWLPQQKMSRKAALELFTRGAAYAAHQEQVLGQLQPGYFADFILIDGDYFALPEAALWQIPVRATYVAGKRVFPAAGAGPT